jgi:hypothetical protein
MEAVVACTTTLGAPEFTIVSNYVYNVNEVPAFDQLSADEMKAYENYDDAGWVSVHDDQSLYDLDWDNVMEEGNAKQKCLAVRMVQGGDEQL